MSTSPQQAPQRPATPFTFWDEAVRRFQQRFHDEEIPSGGWGSFEPWTGQHLVSNPQDIPEIVRPGPPSPGLSPTPMDEVLLAAEWGQANQDRMLYMSGDE